jgi:hypothetical protein
MSAAVAEIQQRGMEPMTNTSAPGWVEAAAKELAIAFDCAQWEDDRVKRSAPRIEEIICKHVSAGAKWVSVKDTPPRDYLPVWTAWRHQDKWKVSYGYHQRNAWYFDDGDDGQTLYEDYGMVIEYWMPIDYPPDPIS